MNKISENILFGELEAYYEQGWEGRIEYAFYPNEPDKANIALPCFLTNGQHLTIFSSDNNILWSGIIDFVGLNWWDQATSKHTIWAGCKQKGVAYKDWLAWFWHKPPLKAKLKL